MTAPWILPFIWNWICSALAAAWHTDDVQFHADRQRNVSTGRTMPYYYKADGVMEAYYTAHNYRAELEPKFYSDVTSFQVTLYNLNYGTAPLPAISLPN